LEKILKGFAALILVGASGWLVSEPIPPQPAMAQVEPKSARQEPVSPPSRFGATLTPIRFDPMPAVASLSPGTAHPSRGPGIVIDTAALSWLPPEFHLEAGDVVLRIDGEEVGSRDQLVAIARGSSEGSAVQLEVRLAHTNETVSFWASR
jgi:S1-C subfamily serine protease